VLSPPQPLLLHTHALRCGTRARQMQTQQSVASSRVALRSVFTH
jgi:hypothetical protein